MQKRWFGSGCYRSADVDAVTYLVNQFVSDENLQLVDDRLRYSKANVGVLPG